MQEVAGSEEQLAPIDTGSFTAEQQRKHLAGEGGEAPDQAIPLFPGLN